jgi:hypothetical protein
VKRAKLRFLASPALNDSREGGLKNSFGGAAVFSLFGTASPKTTCEAIGEVVPKGP